ncbi:MAG TPA: phosphoglucomutase (alpha-D-glucose-1,6-bisphosphate-dependent) [Chitinophagaceae bacterium]|jgi:phosphoglucomutase|nr:phosphoglucomutase (alpha-D-glucose-1,6-bisphosphate-dependent) [Chitinophagaceae bacterium]
MEISSLAGKPASPEILVDIPKLLTAYYTGKPDVSDPQQRVSFGTSGHRGSSFKNSFNENHILAITQAICLYRKEQKTDGPLFLGFDTHALSAPAYATALEVLAANEIEVMIANGDEYTPTPAISHAILKYNKDRKAGLADGIVITPSHNPPGDGGFKYNPLNGGPAGSNVTNWIENKANELLKNNLQTIKRISFDKSVKASTTHRYDYVSTYINDLGNIIDMVAIGNSTIKMGVDPLGGAGVHYWEPIAEKYKIDLTVVNKIVDPTFGFMTVDWDGQIRMDPSSPYAMQPLIAMKDKFDILFACDTDHDRHGIVTKTVGLLNPNHYLSVAVFYLLQNRPQWATTSAVGKTVVTTELIDRIATKSNRKVFEVPVGFKWFVDGLLNGSLCFGGEESAGASFLRLDGSVWTTDKDGFIPSLLSAEIIAKTGKDPALLYQDITTNFGEPVYKRIEVKATIEQQEKLKNISADQIENKELAGEKITSIITNAPGNNASVGGIKINTKNAWYAIRPSGTEAIYKIYAESFLGEEHLERVISDAQEIANTALKNK